MITPTRLGLKYAPVPTLALEYEDDLSGVEDAGATSLFVLREGEGEGEASRRRVKKLHVVELPLLTRTSETRRIVEQLQRDNSRLLSPNVVNESQLTRLLDQLVEHLGAVSAGIEPTEQGVGMPTTKTDSVVHAPVAGINQEEEEEEEELEEIDESFIEDSVAESSQALESSATPSDHKHVDRPVELTLATPALTMNRGTFLSQEDSESKDERHEANGEESEYKSKADTVLAEGGEGQGDDADDEQLDSPYKVAAQTNAQASAAAAADEMEKRKDEEEDEEKKRVLKSGSEVSEEDIQSEELEYFSEDGSDEDSF